jgi:hypothetical protein
VSRFKSLDCFGTETQGRAIFVSLALLHHLSGFQPFEFAEGVNRIDKWRAFFRPGVADL